MVPQLIVPIGHDLAAGKGLHDQAPPTFYWIGFDSKPRGRFDSNYFRERGMYEKTRRAMGRIDRISGIRAEAGAER